MHEHGLAQAWSFSQLLQPPSIHLHIACRVKHESRNTLTHSNKSCLNIVGNVASIMYSLVGSATLRSQTKVFRLKCASEELAAVCIYTAEHACTYTCCTWAAVLDCCSALLVVTGNTAYCAFAAAATQHNSPSTAAITVSLQLPDTYEYTCSIDCFVPPPVMAYVGAALPPLTKSDRRC